MDKYARHKAAQLLVNALLDCIPESDANYWELREISKFLGVYSPCMLYGTDIEDIHRQLASFL